MSPTPGRVERAAGEARTIEEKDCRRETEAFRVGGGGVGAVSDNLDWDDRGEGRGRLNRVSLKSFYGYASRVRRENERKGLGRGTHPKVADQRRHIGLVDAAHTCQRARQVRHVRVVDAFADHVGRFPLELLVRLEVATGFLRSAGVSLRRGGCQPAVLDDSHCSTTGARGCGGKIRAKGDRTHVQQVMSV